jgi:2-polyprenyl-6-methoxyphenol hydroxylase-like FAD-dependent oxidoreductase
LPEVSFQVSSTVQALTFQSNEVHNFVAIFKSDEKVDHEDWQTSVDSSALLSRYADFHPSALAVLRKAKEIKQWPLLFRAPIPTWYKEKLVLIGDAAHPMLPHQGQGGAQAIEDAVALGICLTSCTPSDLESRLQTFSSIRRTRASVMQIFSNAGQDEPEKIHTEAAKFIPAEDVPSKSLISSPSHLIFPILLPIPFRILYPDSYYFFLLGFWLRTFGTGWNGGWPFQIWKGMLM